MLMSKAGSPREIGGMEVKCVGRLGSSKKKEVEGGGLYRFLDCHNCKIEFADPAVRVTMDASERFQTTKVKQRGLRSQRRRR